MAMWIRRRLLLTAYVAMVALLGIAALEGTLRLLGLGDPVLYYEAAWGGRRPLPDQHIQRRKGATVTIDATGFRNARPCDPSEARVLFLGDSVTWGGTGLDDSEIFSAIAEERLARSGIEICAMNAGVNGTSLRNHAEVYRSSGDGDAVVWLFPWGDVHRGFAGMSDLIPARFKPRLALVEMLDFVAVRYWSRTLRRSVSSGREFRDIAVPAGYEGFFAAELEARRERNLEAAGHVVRDAVGSRRPILIGISPYLAGARLESLPPEADDFLRRVEAAGGRVLRSAEALMRETEDVAELYLDGVHFNARGHRVIGELIARELQHALAPG